jgi:hypothetical protein
MYSSTASRMVLGSDSNLGTLQFNGTMDQVYFADRAWGAADVGIFEGYRIT